MRSRLRLLTLSAALAALFTSDAGAGERIYVLSQSGSALSAFEDESEAETLFTLALDKAPAAMALAPASARAYITHPDLGQVTVVDLASRRVTQKLQIGGSPFGIAVASDGRIFVGDWNGAHVSILDADGRAAPTRVAVGRAPAHLLLSPDESLLFVANRESDDVSVVRTDDLTVAATIPVGRAPFALALSPDAARLYVANVQAGTVSVIDTGKREVIETWASGGAMPYGAAVTPDGSRLVVTNQQAGTLSILDRSGAPSPSVRVGGYPEGVTIGAGGRRAYVANWFSDDISVVDLERGREIHRIKCAGGPRGIVIGARLP
ncbi:YncE family protein [Hyphomicrobium sp.]|uniref:YncE family protein n=1 Tax=Hyphomicrobium sp. TaxID=82 RepID=UPI002FDDB92C